MSALKKLAIGAALSVSLAGAQAALMAIDFSLASSTGGSVTGTGTAYTDSSNLDPLDFTIDPSQLVAMTLSMAGVPGGGSATTSFTKADLNELEWVLSVDGAGTINDLNFFMRNGGPNADGYSIEGIAPFNGVLCAGSANINSCAGTTLDSFVIRIDGVHAAAVPAPTSVALLGLGLVGLGAIRRRR